MMSDLNGYERQGTSSGQVGNNVNREQLQDMCIISTKPFWTCVKNKESLFFKIKKCFCLLHQY